MPANPFLTPAGLYASPTRIALRTRALHEAKIVGRPAADVIASLAPARPSTVTDIGCGRGSTTAAIAQRLNPPTLIALDASPALLNAARSRIARAGIAYVCADFHSFPLPDKACDLVVAAFCLYHSPAPHLVIREIRRCLTPGGTAILATKSADSYKELDMLVGQSGLDPAATSRPSLYGTAHSGNMPALASTALDVREVVHERHAFRFANLGHLAEYLITTPKYAFPDAVRHDPLALAAQLRASMPEQPLETSSIVTFVVAHRPS